MHLSIAARRAGLVARQHLGRTGTGVAQVAADLVALHSSDPLTPHLALWARIGGYRTIDLETELVQTRSLWRLHAMRRTLWVAGTDEVGVLHGAAGHARELTAALPDLTTKITVGSGKWATETAIASRVLYLLAMDLTLVRTAPAGSWKSSQYGWALPDAVPPVDPEEARGRLVRRYVERFGPVTRTDVKWWTGFTVAHTKQALQAAEAKPVSIEGADGWHLPELALDGLADSPSICLLPGLDPTPMGYKERGWFLGDHQTALFDRNGNVGPTVWVDGRIVGGWAVRADGSVVVRLLEDVGAEAGVEARSADLSAWLDGTPITPRFRTPLERELAAT